MWKPTSRIPLVLGEGRGEVPNAKTYAAVNEHVSFKWAVP
jgi:hypothetical protein